MIKAEIENGTVNCSGVGSVLDILSDISELIGSIYRNYITAGRTETAELFRALMTAAMAHPESPVWRLSGDGEGVMMCIPKTKEVDDAES